jgi:NAD(P)-dependent dehydrogenase (short-subunit alcohol dehydrogenase family)
MGRLEGKNSIITGAAGGIGLETSILFAQNGANVLMSDINAEQLSKAVAKVQGFAPNAKVEAFVSPHPSSP